LELDEVHLKVVDSSYEDEWLVDDAITLDEVKDAISKLSDKYKYVVMMFLIEGYDHQEIAEVLNITEVASRTQLSRGKAKLKELLKTVKSARKVNGGDDKQSKLVLLPLDNLFKAAKGN